MTTRTLEAVVVVCLVICISMLKYGGDKLHRSPDGWDETSILRMVLEIKSPEEMARKFVSPGWQYYRPIGLASLWLDREISGHPADNSQQELMSGDTAYQFLCTNLAWHILGALAFGWMLMVMFRSPLAGGIASILYAGTAANGITAEWFAARFDLISAVMIFTTVGCFVCHLRSQKDTRKWWLFGAILAMVFGLMAKENALVLPLFLSVVTILLAGSQGWNWRKGAYGLVAIWLTAAAYLVLRHFMIQGFMDPATVAQVHEPRFWNALVKMYFLPLLWLSNFFHSYSGLGIWFILDGAFWKIAFLVSLAGASIVVFRSRWQQAVTLWMWVLVFYAPVACIFTYNGFQHYLALPKAGYSAMVALVIASWIGWLFERWPTWQRQIVIRTAGHIRQTRPARARVH